jgi:nucleoside-diphosphate-sugar epimerase
MMRVVVTGGSGLVATYLIDNLLQSGHEVVSVDRVKPAAPRAAYRLADLEDLGHVYSCLEQAEAVIHLAALHLGTEPNQVVFRTNVMSTYNILEASAGLGIRKVVLASSKSVLGFPGFYQPFAPYYAPIDEEHPLLPQDSYALSKIVGEETASAFVRRTDMSVISLRPTWIHTPDTFQKYIPPIWDNPAAGASILWCYVDVRDVAQAFELAINAELPGHEAFYIAADNSFMKRPTSELLRRFYPKTELRLEQGDCWSVLSSAKAARVLGYKSRYSWESYLGVQDEN